MGFEVHGTTSIDDFLENIKKSKYKFVMFDDVMLGNSIELVIDIVKESYSIPCAFNVLNSAKKLSCEVISSRINYEAIKNQLAKL